MGFHYDYRLSPDALPYALTVACWMWESTELPRDRVAAINTSVDLLYVPSEHNRVVFEQCGVAVPTRVLPHGVDASLFPYLERPIDREPFTFGTFGDLSARKGVDVLTRAFLDEFSPAEPVRLLLKATSRVAGVASADPRIETISGFMTHAELLEVLRRMDAYVLPSRGEGFGLTGLEAMATGLPVIATAWSGPTEYLDDADTFALSYRLVDAESVPDTPVPYRGVWAEPDHEHLRELMRWVFEHRSEAAAKGRAASARAHRDWTWERPARMVVDDVDALVAARS